MNSVCRFFADPIMRHRAGGPVEDVDGYKMLPAPPIAVLMNQQLTESYQSTSDGVNKKLTHIDQSLFAVTCAVDKTALTIFPLAISIKLDSITAMPIRKRCSLLKFMRPCSGVGAELLNGDGSITASKRRKLETTQTQRQSMVDVMIEATRFAEILSDTIDSQLDYDEIEENI